MIFGSPTALVEMVDVEAMAISGSGLQRRRYRIHKIHPAKKTMTL